MLPSMTRSLPIVLIRARETVMAPIRKMLSETDITEQQWRVLRALAEFGPMDASSLADRASLLFPSLTRIAQTMRTKGLISQMPDPRDRRRQTIAITADGQALIDKHSQQAAQIVEGYKARLGEENYEHLLELLLKLEDSDED